jgi:hypothetical protein
MSEFQLRNCGRKILPRIRDIPSLFNFRFLCLEANSFLFGCLLMLLSSSLVRSHAENIKVISVEGEESGTSEFFIQNRKHRISRRRSNPIQAQNPFASSLRTKLNEEKNLHAERKLQLARSNSVESS